MTTLGKTTDGASVSTSSTNKTIVCKVTAVGNGVLASGVGRIWVDTGAASASQVVYADSAGAVGALLAQSASAALGNSEANVSFTYSGGNQINIIDAVDYWIGFTWPDPGTSNINWSRDGTASQTQQINSLSPNPFGTPGTPLAGPIDCYIEHFPAGPVDYGDFFDFF